MGHRKALSVGDTRMMCFDTARALAIIVVMFVHCHGLPWGGLYLTAAYMPLFFVVAGYFAHARTRSILNQLTKHARRLLLPYFAYSIALFGISLWQKASAETLKQTDALREGIGVLYARYQLYPGQTQPNVIWFSHFNYPLWFLPALFLAYAVFFPLARWCGQTMWRCGLVACGLLGVTVLLNRLPILLPWGADIAFLGAFFLLCGMLLARTRCFTACVSPLSVGLLLCGTAAYVWLCRWNGSINLSIREHGDHGAYSVLAGAVLGVLGSVLAVWLARFVDFIPVAGKALAAVGRNTMPVLCLHRLCMFCIDEAFGWFGVSFYKPEMFGTQLVYWLCVSGKVALALVMCIGLAQAGKAARYALQYAYETLRARKQENEHNNTTAMPTA